MVERVLATLGVKVGAMPRSSVAMMRSMLTHPDATEIAVLRPAFVELAGGALPRSGG